MESNDPKAKNNPTKRIFAGFNHKTREAFVCILSILMRIRVRLFHSRLTAHRTSFAMLQVGRGDTAILQIARRWSEFDVGGNDSSEDI